jgi:hypothetical protein
VVTQRDPLIDALVTRSDRVGWLTPEQRVANVVDALPTLLLEESPAGDRLRTRLGLRLDRTLANLGPNGVAMYGGPVNDRTRLVALHSGWFEVSDE